MSAHGNPHERARAWTRVEQALLDVEGVDAAAAFDLPPADAGPRVAVVVAGRPPVATLADRSRQVLAEGDRPVAYGLVDALPAVGDAAARRSEVRDLARRGVVGLLAPEEGHGKPRDAGPRAVPDLPWVRQIRLPLGAHARGSVNAYLVDTDEGAVLLDTGFSSTVEMLRDALLVAGVGPGDLRAVLCTHNHADHVGAARWLQEEGWLAADGEVVLHKMTDYVGRAVFVEHADAFAAQLVGNGIDGADLGEWEQDLVDMAALARWPEADRLVDDETRLAIGGVTFEFLYTPGHSPDHCALLAESDAGHVVFLGDLTLGRGMPMVGVRDFVRDDPIADLLASWHRLLERAGGTGLPGHGGRVEDLASLHGDITAAYRSDLQGFVERFGGRAVSAGDAMRELTRLDSPFGVRQFSFYGSLARLHHLAGRGLAHLVSEDPARFLVERGPGGRGEGR